MAAPYLTNLQDLVDASLGASAGQVTCKHFFSGAAAYLDDKIIATLSPVGLAFKLSETSCQRHLNADAIPLRYFPKSPVKRGYALFDDYADLGPGRVASLLTESINHARSALSEGPGSSTTSSEEG
jgi:TfoX/Sxy family transcriptional regulator of competence genes